MRTFLGNSRWILHLEQTPCKFQAAISFILLTVFIYWLVYFHIVFGYLWFESLGRYGLCWMVDWACIGITDLWRPVLNLCLEITIQMYVFETSSHKCHSTLCVNRKTYYIIPIMSSYNVSLPNIAIEFVNIYHLFKYALLNTLNQAGKWRSLKGCLSACWPCIWQKPGSIPWCLAILFEVFSGYLGHSRWMPGLFFVLGHVTLLPIPSPPFPNHRGKNRKHLNSLRHWRTLNITIQPTQSLNTYVK